MALKQLVSDAGEIIDQGDYLLISTFPPETVAISVFRQVFDSPEQMETAFKDVRLESAQLLASLTKRQVQALFRNGTHEVINP